MPSTSPRGRRLDRREHVVVCSTGVPAERLDALVADAPGRDVDDPLERDAVRVGPEDPQVGQRVLDLAPLVEPRAADELVADPVAEERLLDGPRLRVHPVHHGDVLGPEPGASSSSSARRVSHEPRPV